jgi:hypothetical protein
MKCAFKYCEEPNENIVFALAVGFVHAACYERAQRAAVYDMYRVVDARDLKPSSEL